MSRPVIHGVGSLPFQGSFLEVVEWPVLAPHVIHRVGHQRPRNRFHPVTHYVYDLMFLVLALSSFSRSLPLSARADTGMWFHSCGHGSYVTKLRAQYIFLVLYSTEASLGESIGHRTSGLSIAPITQVCPTNKSPVCMLGDRLIKYLPVRQIPKHPLNPSSWLPPVRLQRKNAKFGFKQTSIGQSHGTTEKHSVVH